METLEEYIARAAREGIPLDEVQRVVNRYQAATDAAYVAAGVLSPDDVRRSRFGDGLFITTTGPAPVEGEVVLSNGGEPIGRWDAPVEPDQILRDIQQLTNDISRAAFQPMQPAFLPIVPVAFEAYEGQTAEDIAPMMARTGGVMVRYPRAMTYMDGIVGQEFGNAWRDGMPYGYDVELRVGRRTMRTIPHVSNENPPNPGASMRFNGRRVDREFLGSLAARYGVVVLAQHCRDKHADAPVVNAPSHGLQTGDGPFQVTAAQLPEGLVEGARYWVIRMSPDTFKIAETEPCGNCRHRIGNRHHAKRWLRMFAPIAAVAADALESDQPSLCFELLCAHITLEDAMRLVYGARVPELSATERAYFDRQLEPTYPGQVREYTTIEDVERDFGTRSDAYDNARSMFDATRPVSIGGSWPESPVPGEPVTVVTQGAVYMESETPLEIGDLVAMGTEPNSVRYAEIEDRIAGRVEGVTVSGGPLGTRYLALVRVGGYGAVEHWERACYHAFRTIDRVKANESGAQRLLVAALEVARRWDPEASGSFDIGRQMGVTTVVLRAHLFGEQVYASVNT